jgi:hypothetical protein
VPQETRSAGIARETPVGHLINRRMPPEVLTYFSRY